MGDAMIPLDPTPNLIDQVYARILEGIADHSLPPGQRIRQAELAERLGVGETIVPLLDDEMGLPAVRSFQVEAKARYVDHSVAGGDVTWSVGGRIEPRIPGMTIRGVYTRAIRAPSIVELYLNSTPVAGGANDVCAASRVNTGSNPAVRLANCTAALAAVGGPAPAAFLPTTNGASPFGVAGGGMTGHSIPAIPRGEARKLRDLLLDMGA